MPEYRDLNDLFAGVLNTVRGELAAGKQRKSEFADTQHDRGVASEKEASDRAMKEAEFELDQQYKQGQLKAKEQEKPLTLQQLIGKAAQKEYESGRMGLNDLIDLERKRTGKDKSGGDDVLNRQTLGKAQQAFLEGRQKVPVEYEDTDYYGEPTTKIRFQNAPITGGTLDTLTQIGMGKFPAGTDDTTKVPTPGSTIQGFPLDQARQMGKKKGFGPDGSFPTEEEYLEAKRLGIVR